MLIFFWFFDQVKNIVTDTSITPHIAQSRSRGILEANKSVDMKPKMTNAPNLPKIAQNMSKIEANVIAAKPKISKLRPMRNGVYKY